MNALMTIQVRVASAQAMAQLKALEAQELRTATATRAVGSAARWGIPWMAKWGSQVQWMGRQLTYNFAIPIALAMGLATKFALENEKAMVRVTKVYGDGSKVFNKLSQTEIPALQRAFEQLSNQFAVHQDQVISIAGDWAAAGASGVALAKAVKLTLETMVLGELEAAEATKALIAIQAQYGMNTEELTKTIDILNMVENQTGATMGDLITGMSRAAGVAKTAGVDVEHLSAMMAALVPATGSAASAGNGLKTMISRLLSPTKEAVEVMQAMGVEVNETAWQTLTGTQRLEAMGEAYSNLSSAQKIHVATLVASRYQLNRFSILMDAINNQNSYYWRSLKATSDRQKIYAQRQKELNQVLTSSPQKLQQTWNILRNAMADVIIPIIPLIVYVAQVIARLGHAFSELDPRIQKLVLAIGAFIVVFAVGTKLLGAFVVLLSTLAATLHFLAIAFLKTAGFIVKPFIWALGVVTEVVWLMARSVFAAMSFMVTSTIRGMTIAVAAVVRGVAAMTVAALWSPIGVMVETLWLAIIGFFSAGATAVFGIFTGWLSSMWTAFYIWRVGMLGALATWALQVGAVFTLLGSFVVEALATLWAWMTVPGLLSGYILGIWTTLMAGMTRLWMAAQVVMLRAWTVFNTMLIAIAAAMQRGLAGIWMAMVFLWNTVLINMRFLWAATMATMQAIAAISMTRIIAVFAMLPQALAAIGSAIIAVLTSPWTLLVAAVLGILYLFRNQIVDLWNNIVSGIRSSTFGPIQQIGDWFVSLANLISDAFWSLPESVTGAMLAILNVVKTVALQIYEWMSYLNPFATHSPSLVSSVTEGMKVIENEYGRVAKVSGLFAQAAADLEKFKKMMPKGGEFASERIDVAKHVPKALPLFDKLTNHLKELNQVLAQQEARVNRQQAVVDRWKAALERANAVLDRQQDKLSKMQDKLSDLQAQYDAAAQAVQDYADAPLQGMQAMSDAMFENEMAQKKLQLQMLQWEQVNGPIDDARDRLAKLHGEIDLLRGQAAALRSAGAGSEILGPIEDQIAALEAQAKATTQAIRDNPVDKMQEQLEQLQKEGQMLQLQYDLNFDPLTRQIDKLANTQKELSYDEIVAGIKSAQAVMAQLQPQIEAQTAAVAEQQAYVDKLVQARDELEKIYDRENKKLDRLNEAYQKTKDLITDIEGALRDMASAATQAAQALEDAKKKGEGGAGGGAMGNALKTFQAGAGANFPEAGGNNAISREGGFEDQSALIDQFTQQSLDEMNQIFGGFDMLGPIKGAWNKAWGWVVENLGPIGSKIVAGVDATFQAIGDIIGGVGSGGVGENIQGIIDLLVDMGEFIAKWIGRLWDLIGPDIIKIGEVFKKFFLDIWHELGPELAKFAPVLSKVGEAMKNLWTWAKPVVSIMLGALFFAIKLIASVLAETLGPILDGIILILKGFIQIIRGVFEVVIGLLTGDWEMAWQGAKDILIGILNTLWGVLVGVFGAIWGLIEGLVKGIWGFFKWLWDVLFGHSIIPDIIDAFWKYFKQLADIAMWVWNHVAKPIFNKVKDLWPLVRDELSDWWARIKTVWNALTTAATWVWNNVLDPIFTKVKNLWDNNVKPELQNWWERIKNVWDNLTKAATWIKNNVMDPVFEAFKTGWNSIKTWFSDNSATLLAPIKSVVRGFISAINWIIKGINKLDALPGVDISIGEVSLPDTFASGGIPRRRVGNGFMTHGARAIVGEGKAAYPEFVIPTDPTYRGRALGLLQMAATRLGAHRDYPGVWGDFGGGINPAQILKDNPVGVYGLGGIIGDVVGAVGNQMLNLGEAAVGLSKNAISLIMKPMIALAHKAAGKIDWSTGQDAANGMIDLVEQWVKGADQAFNEELEAAVAASKKGKLSAGLKFAKSQAGKPYKMVYNAVGPDYYDCSGFMSAVTRAIMGQNPHLARIGTTANFPWLMYGKVTQAAKDAMSIGSTSNYGGTGTGHMAGTLLGVNIESNGDQGVVIGGRGAFNDGNFTTHAQLLLAGGGVVRRRTGGVLARIGEGGHDELVAPLPHNWRSDAFGSGSDNSGGRVINIYGNLEFPNVTDGSDADDFIKNLESMARD